MVLKPCLGAFSFMLSLSVIRGLISLLSRPSSVALERNHGVAFFVVMSNSRIFATQTVRLLIPGLKRLEIAAELSRNSETGSRLNG